MIVSFTLHHDERGALRSGEGFSDAIAAVKAFPLAGVAANCCSPKRISDAIPIICGSGLELVAGYANEFTHVPGEWLLDGAKATDGHLQMCDVLTPGIHARFGHAWVEAGAPLIGGCCGIQTRCAL